MAAKLSPGCARRLTNGTIARGGLPEVFPDWHDEERWLILTPHDDDPALSAALLLAEASRIGVTLRVRIATDGSMGYTPVVSASDVVERRRRETTASFRLLGVHDVAWYDYPDTRLYRWQGRIPVDDVVLSRGLHVVAGHTGLQNSIVAELRAFDPTRVFVFSARDYHPDHKTVHQEALISLFHALGDIWPELGRPQATAPWIHELAAYCPFVADPDIRIVGTDAQFDTKLAAIRAFASQTQIATLVEAVRAAGPVEYVRSFEFATYSPSLYADLFADTPPPDR